MDFGKAFSFITADKEWFKKIIIGGLLTVLGITFPAVIGWMVEIIRRVSAGNPEPLPGWDNIGGYFVDGLKMIGVGLVWMLPIILISICFTPITILAAENLDYETGGMVITLSTICFSLFVLVYSLAVAVVLLPLPGLVAENRSFSELLRPNTSLRYVRANIGGYLIAAIGGSFISNFIGSLGVILCGIGTLITVPFGLAVYAHLMGQAHAQSVQNQQLLAPPTA